MNFTLNVLGTASAKPTSSRNPSAQVLDVRGRLFLVDCGEGAQRQMCRQRLSFDRIDAIFISHIHGDHVFGLPGLLSTIGLASSRKSIKVFGPQALGAILKFYLSYYGDQIGIQVDFIPVKTKSPQVIFENKFLIVEAFPLNHRIETYGYLFRERTPELNVRKDAIGQYGLGIAEICKLKRGEDVVRGDFSEAETSFENGTSPVDTSSAQIIRSADVTYLPYTPRSYAYCSDTAPFPQLPEWVRGVDLLYTEATYMEDLAKQAAQRYHSTTLQAARLAVESGAKKLIVAHYSSRYKDTAPLLGEIRSVFPNSFAANDGDVFDVPLDKKEF